MNEALYRYYLRNSDQISSRGFFQRGDFQEAVELNQT